MNLLPFPWLYLTQLKLQDKLNTYILHILDSNVTITQLEKKSALPATPHALLWLHRWHEEKHGACPTGKGVSRPPD